MTSMITLRFPPGAHIAVINRAGRVGGDWQTGAQWRREDDGSITAWYDRDRFGMDELQWCLAATRREPKGD